jgi:hypothetical protein
LTQISPDFSPLDIDSEEGLVGVAFSIAPYFKNMKMLFLVVVLADFCHRKVKWSKNLLQS